MRFVLLCAAALCLSSFARADFLVPESASFTYWTASDTLSIRIEYERPPELPDDMAFFRILDNPNEIWFTALPGTFPNQPIATRVFGPDGPDHSTAPYTLTGSLLSIDVPFSNYPLSGPDFRFAVMSPDGTIEGQSSINSVVTYSHVTPEPSSIALALLSGIPLWRRYKRNRAKVQ